MKKSVLLLVLFLGCVMLNGQKIQKDNGKWYKFRLTKEQMRDVMLSRKTLEKRKRLEQSYLRDLVGVYSVDSVPVKQHSQYKRLIDDTTAGLWAWAKQGGNKIQVQYVNNPPFKVSVGGDQLRSYGVSKQWVVVRIFGMDAKSARVTLRDNAGNAVKSLKWSEKDSAFVCSLARGKTTMLVLVEMDGYVQMVDLWGYPCLEYRSRVYKPEMSWGVTDKNMYKPGETVKWKFVMVDHKGKPCKGGVDVSLNDEIVCTGELDRNGAIAGETQLTDSFKLRSGETFSLSARVHSGFEKQLLCRYRDYELKSLNATAMVENDVTRGDTIRVRVNATDERKKPVMDGRVWGAWVLTDLTGMDGDLIRLGDTTKIDAVDINDGEAVLEIPTNDFPMADVNVRVSWRLRTSDGEERSGWEQVRCKRTSEETKAESATSVRYDDVCIARYDMADSVGFSFDGKGKRYNWVIYRKGRAVASGVDSVMSWRVKESGNADYLCVVTQYIQSDVKQYVSPKKWSETINHSADALKVRVEQKVSVRPGEEDEVTLVVTDGKGRPVEGADLTALAATSKLGHYVEAPTLRSAQAYQYDEMNDVIVNREIYSILTDSVAEQIVEAASVQYWRLINARDSVVVVETTSKVGSQIVPVLVRNGAIQKVAYVIVNGKFYMPGVENRYAIVPRMGENNIDFCTSDSMFSATVTINDTLPVKRWLGIPVSSCKTAKADKQQLNFALYYTKNSVTDYEGGGRPFLLCDEEIIPLVGGRGLNVAGYGGVAVGAVSMDSVIRRAPVELGSSRTITLYHDPTVIKYEIPSQSMGMDYSYTVSTNSKSKADVTPSVSAQLVSLNDSICTIDELRRRWIEKLDEMRRSEHSVIPSGYKCMVQMVDNRDELKPLQVCYREKDSTEWLLNGYSSVIVMPADRDMEVVFMYDGGIARRLNIRVGMVERVFVRSSCRKGEGVVDRALEREMRLRMESLCAGKAEKYDVRLAGGKVGASNKLLYQSQVDESGEVMAVAYGLSSKKMSKRTLYGSRGIVMYETISEVSEANSAYSEDEMVYELGDVMIVEADDSVADIRDVFNDVAFFVTDCHTDKNGRAVMRVKYPDDLTNWSEWFVAIRGKQRGITKSSVKAEKEQEAKLNMPRFAVEGDTVGAVGVGVDRATGEHRCDTLTAVAVGDSLCMQYAFKSDGERRCVPIYSQGLQMIEGTYHEIDSDAVVRLEYNPEYGEMKVGVFGDAREMMMNSVARVASQDWCEANDFMANRLRALRMLPKCDSIERIMTQIEKKLMKNRCANGMWSWWGSDGVGTLWATQRVLEAIGGDENAALEAELALRREMNRGRWYELLNIAKIYRLIGKAEIAREIANGIPDDSIFSTRLRIDKQMLENREVRFDTMRHTTYTDGSYYSYRTGNGPWFCVTCEEVMTTLQAYEYYMALGDREECKSIKRWLLQYGLKGFMSERVEMEIVSAIWNGQPIGASEMLWQLSVDGRAIEKLPYHTTVNRAIDVEYKGRRDVYVSTEQNWWNRTPMAQGNGMTISTSYSKGVITVVVNVEHTAENVIISVPVPAGCSYADSQSRSYSETFREEYRDRVNIYCYQLREGRHLFTVRLNERYPGVYTLNPAQIRLADYPVFNANNEVKRVVIR